MCLNLPFSCFIKHQPEKFYHFFCDKYVEHWRLYAENKIVLDILSERYKPHFTYILSYTTKQRTSSCLLANCLHAISHFNSLPQLLAKSLYLCGYATNHTNRSVCYCRMYVFLHISDNPITLELTFKTEDFFLRKKFGVMRSERSTAMKSLSWPKEKCF